MGMQIARPIPLADTPCASAVFSLNSPVPGTAADPAATPPMVPQEELVDLLEEQNPVNTAEEQLSAGHSVVVFISNGPHKKS